MSEEGRKTGRWGREEGARKTHRRERTARKDVLMGLK